jgi:hypothetical protein
MSHELWSDLVGAIETNNAAQFESSLQTQDLSQLKPRLINDLLLKSLETPRKHEFIELLMHRLHVTKSNYICWDDTCKVIVNSSLSTDHKFSKFSIEFLLRCCDVECVRRVLAADLIDVECSDCENWQLMFIASYQDRFFTNSLDSLFQGFLVRSILVCVLRCPLVQKRTFLTWFAGSLHLCIDENFLQYERPLFKFSLFKIFETLILNGLLNQSEFTSLLEMLLNRNAEVADSLTSHNKILGVSSGDSTNRPDTLTDRLPVVRSLNAYFSELRTIFPLSLKNSCRLTIKHNLMAYTKSSVERLHLPANLKRFLLFDAERDSIYTSFSLMKSES